MVGGGGSSSHSNLQALHSRKTCSLETTRSLEHRGHPMAVFYWFAAIGTLLCASRWAEAKNL